MFSMSGLKKYKKIQKQNKKLFYFEKQTKSVSTNVEINPLCQNQSYFCQTATGSTEIF